MSKLLNYFHMKWCRIRGGKGISFLRADWTSWLWVKWRCPTSRTRSKRHRRKSQGWRDLYPPPPNAFWPGGWSIGSPPQKWHIKWCLKRCFLFCFVLFCFVLCFVFCVLCFVWFFLCFCCWGGGGVSFVMHYANKNQCDPPNCLTLFLHSI